MTFQEHVHACIKQRRVNELAAGFLRYEALRKLTLLEFKYLKIMNLKGANFDSLVDDLVLKQAEEHYDS